MNHGAIFLVNGEIAALPCDRSDMIALNWQWLR